MSSPFLNFAEIRWSSEIWNTGMWFISYSVKQSCIYEKYDLGNDKCPYEYHIES